MRIKTHSEAWPGLSSEFGAGPAQGPVGAERQAGLGQHLCRERGGGAGEGSRPWWRASGLISDPQRGMWSLGLSYPLEGVLCKSASFLLWLVECLLLSREQLGIWKT